MKSYRVYFNCRQDFPRVWSYDEGPGTKEEMVAKVTLFDCDAVTRFDPSKHLPEPSAWIEVKGYLAEQQNEVVIHCGAFRAMDKQAV